MVANGQRAQAEGAAGHLSVHHGQPVRDHGAAADRAQKRQTMLLVEAKIGTALLNLIEVVANPLQITGNERAIAEQ